VKKKGLKKGIMTMHRRYSAALAASLVILALMVGACGKSEEKADAEDPNRTLLDIAKRAQMEPSLLEETRELYAMVEQAGFSPRNYTTFLSQEVGKKGRMLTYEDKKKGCGGIIYIKKTGAELKPAWHWYFEDMIPDSVTNVELNDDGLWDLRVVSTDGQAMEFVQGETFTLLAKDREDWIALNGGASAPSPDSEAMWKCFDGDTATVWRSSTADGGAFIEFPAPFGVKDGVLTIQTTGEDQPKACTVYADGAEVQQFPLESKAASQLVKLDAGVLGSKSIRLVFAPSQGNAVAVAEIALK
jgi:hypothetical protein